ncbi:uncharacterized protein TNCV_496071 [Trichonephila clavipes]|nr:uncharacterized protein TNCV_496071 [Trichonephila clavipes]
MRLPLSEPRQIYKDNLETDNRSNISSKFNFEIDLPGKRDRSTIYRLNLIKLYRRKPELANLVMENNSEGIDSETLYSWGRGGVMDKCGHPLQMLVWKETGPELGCVLACYAQMGRGRSRETLGPTNEKGRGVLRTHPWCLKAVRSAGYKCLPFLLVMKCARLYFGIACYEMFGGIPSCEKCWIQVSPVPASDEVFPPVFCKCQNS